MKRILILTSLLIWAISARATTVNVDVTATTGTATVTRTYQPSASVVTTIDVYVVTWTSSALGNVTVRMPYINGTLVKVVVDPGTPAPTAGWDFSLEDDYGLDVLAISGADQSATATGQFVPVLNTYFPNSIASRTTFKVINAGAGKQGVVAFFIRK